MKSLFLNQLHFAGLLLLTAFSVIAAPDKQQFLVGGDISALTVIEEKGGIFKENGQSCDPLEIFKKHGWNCFRLRLFVNPNKEGIVVQDLPYTLALAKRIKSHGFVLMLDLHYSDTWADPGKQIKPKAWESLSFNQLCQQVTDYSAMVMETFEKEGVLPEIVQVGNEVNPGMIWPDGRLSGKGEVYQRQWKKFAALLKAGIRGIRRPLTKEQYPKIIIHICNGGNWQQTHHFIEHLNKYRVPFDILGQSYYPWWHGTLEDVQKNLELTALTYNKDIIIVETAYPHNENITKSGGNWSEERMAWPFSVQGQCDFLKDLIDTVRKTPYDHGCGVIYWYPESIPVKDLFIWFGGAMAVFDEDGNALPAIDALGPQP